MGAEQSVPDVNAEQINAEEDLVAIDAKPVSAVGGARRRPTVATRAKTHKAPSARRNKTRKAK